MNRLSMRGLVLGSLATGLFACPREPPRPAVAASPARSQGSPEWLDHVAAACAKIASCSHPHDPAKVRNPSGCVDRWMAQAQEGKGELDACLAVAKSCAAVRACTQERQADPKSTAFCASHPGVSTACDGNDFVTCAGDDAAENTRVDCSELKGRCEERRTEGLVLRGCASRTLCPPGAKEERCETSTTIVSCHDGIVERTTCAPGMRCDAHDVKSGDSLATCEPEGGHAHCARLGPPYCHDDILVDCATHGHYGDVRLTHCAKIGLVCVEKSGHAGCTVSQKPECEPGPPRCDGEDLAFCAAGVRVKVSCKGLGLGSCNPSALGPAAGCAPR